MMSDLKLAITMAAVGILGFAAIWVGTSYFEAKAYNHITGARISTWDAMWVELRVQEGAKP